MVFHRLVKKLELFQKHVGKIDELCPVVKQYIVVSASHVVAHTTADAGILDLRLDRVRETVNAIKGIDRSGPDKTQILSLLVCPIVFETSSCWSKGSASSLLLYLRKLPQNQCGKASFIM